MKEYWKRFTMKMKSVLYRPQKKLWKMFRKRKMETSEVVKVDSLKPNE